jgi:predicted metalloendopeptidase
VLLGHYKNLLADNAGIKAAFKAYKLYLASNKDPHVQGYKKYSNEQMFFISAAVVSFKKSL